MTCVARSRDGDQIGLVKLQLGVWLWVLLGPMGQDADEFQSLVENSAVARVVVDADRNFVYVNDSFCKLFGFESKDEVFALGTPKTLIAEHDAERVNNMRLDLLVGRINSSYVSFDAITMKGEQRRVEGTMERLNWAGKTATSVSYYDVTEQHLDAERLRAAQRMEAIGHLTGGIAHDFNNALAVIMGSAEYLVNEPVNHPDIIQDILKASERGAKLTRRLLAYARQQPLRPEPFDLADLILGMEGLLARTLGENIEIRITLKEQLWHPIADPSQVEDAILNLAINARDAMPNGGALTIACDNCRIKSEDLESYQDAQPGDYVAFSVSDTGTGMSRRVREQAFEPFFTTKANGVRSGLGLSMVYGFTKQSGGHVCLQSEENRGTRIQICLPRSRVVAEPRAADSRRAAPNGNGESVLVIEDERIVRQVTARMVSNLGYRPISAADAADARGLIAKGQGFDLVLSDIVLPGGASGLEFAEELRDHLPETKVVFMSGYSHKSTGMSAALAANTLLLDKPFRLSELAIALQQALQQ